MDKLRGILKDIADQMLDEEEIIDEYTYLYGKSPEDIVCEKETRQEVSHLIPLAAEFLDYEDRNILVQYIVDGRSMSQIAKDLKITQQAVSDRLKKMPHKLRKYYARFADTIPYFNYAYGGVCVGDPISANFIISKPTTQHSTMKPTFMFEYFVKHGDGGYWGVIHDRPIYKTKTTCHMNEYLDDGVVCSLCKKCKGELNVDT